MIGAIWKCHMLYEFIAVHRDEIIERCRTKVATRSVPPPTAAEINHGVLLFLAQLRQALRHGPSSPEIQTSAALHGHDLLLQGFTMSQVVHDYGDVCQAITELAGEINAPISTDDFRMLNGCLDDAIAAAVTEYGRERHQSTLDGEAARSERAGMLAHELRNLINVAIIAFEELETGNVGVAGSTSAVLHRSLVGLRALIGSSLAEVRLTQGLQNREQFLVSAFIDDLAMAARLEARASGITLRVTPTEGEVAIEADRQILAAVVRNLLQNAFKFTRRRTTVTLRTGASAERVVIEVQDECGGLQGCDNIESFRPFEQRSADRTGLGLGLAFCQLGVEANNGRIYARNIPEEGCVFTVDLPRVPVPVAMDRVPSARQISPG